MNWRQEEPARVKAGAIGKHLLARQQAFGWLQQSGCGTPKYPPSDDSAPTQSARAMASIGELLLPALLNDDVMGGPGLPW